MRDAVCLFLVLSSSLIFITSMVCLILKNRISDVSYQICLLIFCFYIVSLHSVYPMNIEYFLSEVTDADPNDRVDVHH